MRVLLILYVNKDAASVPWGQCWKEIEMPFAPRPGDYILGNGIGDLRVMSDPTNVIWDEETSRLMVFLEPSAVFDSRSLTPENLESYGWSEGEGS